MAQNNLKSTTQSWMFFFAYELEIFPYELEIFLSASNVKMKIHFKWLNIILPFWGVLKQRHWKQYSRAISRKRSMLLVSNWFKSLQHVSFDVNRLLAYENNIMRVILGKKPRRCFGMSYDANLSPRAQYHTVVLMKILRQGFSIWNLFFIYVRKNILFAMHVDWDPPHLSLVACYILHLLVPFPCRNW